MNATDMNASDLGAINAATNGDSNLASGAGPTGATNGSRAVRTTATSGEEQVLEIGVE